MSVNLTLTLTLTPFIHSNRYPEYVGKDEASTYSDVFGFFMDGENVALTPDGRYVGVGSVNCEYTKPNCAL